MADTPAPELGPPGTLIQWSSSLQRRIRTDPITTLGVSSQTIAERALAAGEWDVAADLIQYFPDEMTRINNALYTWLTVILRERYRQLRCRRSGNGAHAGAHSIRA